MKKETEINVSEIIDFSKVKQNKPITYMGVTFEGKVSKGRKMIERNELDKEVKNARIKRHGFYYNNLSRFEYNCVIVTDYGATITATRISHGGSERFIYKGETLSRWDIYENVKKISNI